MHDISLVTTIAFGLFSALAFALIVRSLGMQPIVGYLLAGVAIGPYTPGFVGDTHLAAQLAEIGVILLMFGVGLHFHLKDLLAVRYIAVPGALAQTFAATAAGLAFALAIGWSWEAGFSMGAATAVASTVVLLRVLMDYGRVDSPEGRVAIGWLIVEDILTVVLLVLMPLLAIENVSSGEFLRSVGIVFLELFVLVGLMAFAGAQFVPWLLTRVTRLRSKELFTLTVLVLSISVATVSYLVFGASMALGAFLAGMVVGQSPVSHQAASDALPMRDAFAVLFFVSVGMLFDINAVFSEPLLLAAVLFIVLVIKPAVALFIVLFLGYPIKTALTVGAALAQVGEFSFILMEVAKKLNLVPTEAQNAIIGAAIISISLNPMVFQNTLKLEGRLKKIRLLNKWLDKRAKHRHGKLMEAPLQPTEPNDAIIVGYGPVGRTMYKILEKFGVRPLVIDTNIDTVSELKAEGKKAIFGDASRPDILKDAGIKDAEFLVISISDLESNLLIIENAREQNERVKIFARTRYLRHAPLIESGTTVVAYEEAEVAAILAERLLVTLSVSKWKIRREVRKVQEALRLGLK